MGGVSSCMQPSQQAVVSLLCHPVGSTHGSGVMLGCMIFMVSQGRQGSRGCHSSGIKYDTGSPIGLAVRHPFTGDSAINRVDSLDDEQIIFSECASIAKMVRPIGITTGAVKDHLVIGKHDDLEHVSNL